MKLSLYILCLLLFFCDAGYYHRHPPGWSSLWGHSAYPEYTSQKPHYKYPHYIGNYWGNNDQARNDYPTWNNHQTRTSTSETTPGTLGWWKITQYTATPRTNSPVTTSTAISSIDTTTASSKVTQQPTTTFSTTNVDIFEQLIREAELEESTRSTIVTLPNGTTYDPCQFNPKMPNFDNGLRRISQIKCFEYLWDIKIRKERLEKQDECDRVSGIFKVSVVGGRDALIDEFPHMAAIGWKAKVGEWIFKCGGSLISPNYVLTAAHCTQSRAADIEDEIPKMVRLGYRTIISNFDDQIEPTDANIKNIIKHPNYNSPMKYFDIALMELEKDVEISSLIQPACVWPFTDTSRLGSRATVTGWGVVETGTKDISPTLQTAEVDIIDQHLCDRLIRPYCNRNMCGIRDSQICAGNLTGGVDACQGDSGGPLQVRMNMLPSSVGNLYQIIGVISTGIGCARKDLPGIYTRVSSFIPWIESIVWR